MNRTVRPLDSVRCRRAWKAAAALGLRLLRCNAALRFEIVRMPSVGESEAWLTTTAWRANAMLPITCRGFEAGKRPQGFWQVVEVKLDVGQPRLIFRALRDIVFDEERKIDMARSLLRVRACVCHRDSSGGVDRLRRGRCIPFSLVLPAALSRSISRLESSSISVGALC